MELWPDLCSIAHLKCCFSLSGVCRRASCLQNTAFQLSSSICTTRQTMNRDIQDVEGTVIVVVVGTCPDGSGGPAQSRSNDFFIIKASPHAIVLLSLQFALQNSFYCDLNKQLQLSLLLLILAKLSAEQA